jgi:hypothetical protein
LAAGIIHLEISGGFVNIERELGVRAVLTAQRNKDVRHPQWQLALLALASGIAAFCAGSRAAPLVSNKPPRLNASPASPSFAGAATGTPLAGAYPQFATGLGVRIYDGTNTMLVDPCKGQTKLYASINQTANTQLVTGTASKKIYVCSIHVVVAAATNVALVEGTGSVCGTNTAGVSGFGGATAATGWNFAANGGIAFGNGDSSLGAEGTTGDNLCVFNSGLGQVSGGISYVVQ